MPQCQTYAEDGSRCRLPALRTSEHCLNHDADYREQHQANAAAGGRASGIARNLQPLDLDFVSLAERTSIQGLLDTIFRMELLGTVPAARSRVLIRILSLAIRNFDRPARTGPYDAVKAAHDPAAYQRTRDTFADTTPALLDAVEDNDGARLFRQLSAEANRRRQKWIDEEAFDRVPNAPRRFAEPRTSAEAWEQALRDYPPRTSSSLAK